MTKKMRWSPHSYSFNKTKGTFSENNITASPFEELEKEQIELPLAGTLMETPLGIYDVDDALNPYRNFEFWICHTNFNISAEVAKIIINTPGVEVFKVMTRYRFLLGVGDLFPFQDVRAVLQEKLCGTTIDLSSIAARITDLETIFKEQEYLEWSIYVFPNGKIDFTWLEKDESNIEEYNNKKALLVQAEQFSKGKLYLHERQNRTDSISQE